MGDLGSGLFVLVVSGFTGLFQSARAIELVIREILDLSKWEQVSI